MSSDEQLLFYCRVRDSPLSLKGSIREYTVTIWYKHPNSSNKIESFDKEVSGTIPTLQKILSSSILNKPLNKLN